jgi:Asp/Glu/hydantoin racemase
MKTRILLVHAYGPSIPPIVEAFRTQWPEAEVLNLLDEALYADVGPDGVLAPDMFGRVERLLSHAAQSRADGIIFTGSTFGPAVDAARAQLSIPVLKADEAMCDRIAARSQRVLVVCTAKRALPIIRANILEAAERRGTRPSLTELCPTGAKDAISAGDHATHDRLIAESVEAARDYDVIALGQISMVPAISMLTPATAARVLATPQCSVERMRELVGA